MAGDMEGSQRSGLPRLLGRLGLAVVAASVAALVMAPAAGAVNLTYTFDGSDQGWRVAQANDSPFTLPDFNPSGGNPGGYISARDTGTDEGCNALNPTAPCDLFYFASPGISSTLAANYGGSIAFDFAVNSPAGFAGVLYVDTPVDSAYELVRLWQIPGVGFQRLTAPLTESGWLYCGGTPYGCTDATQAQFRSVLADATFTDVLGDVVNGIGETYSLDNVTVTEKPQPPAKKCKKGSAAKKKANKRKKRATAKKTKCGKKKAKRKKGKKSTLSAPIAPLSR